MNRTSLLLAGTCALPLAAAAQNLNDPAASRHHFGRERFTLPDGHGFKPGGKPKRHGE